VSTTAPERDALNVGLGGMIAVTFSEAMDPNTLSPATFTLMDGEQAIEGIVSYSGVTATFTPKIPLVAKTRYDLAPLSWTPVYMTSSSLSRRSFSF
jgi:hypothetical protein